MQKIYQTKDLPNKEAQVLEQVNHLQSVKKAPFEADIIPGQKAQKLSQNSTESSALDFKNALQKSIQSTKTKDTPQGNAKSKSTKQNELNDTKATLPSTLSNALPNAISSTLSNKANPLAHKNKISSDDEYLLQNALHKSQISPKDTLNGLEKNQNTKKPSLDLSKTPTQDFVQDSIASDILQNALLKDKITPKNALGSSDKSSVESAKKHANALNSIAQNSTKAIHSLESSEPLYEVLEEPTQALQDALEKKDTQTPKKDLNQMARNKNQEETFLSKITQNKANTNVANSTDEAREAGKIGQDELKSLATPPSAQNIPTASAQNSTKTNPQNLAKSLESSTTNSAQTPTNPTLQTVASKAKELGLNPSNISYQESQETTPSTKADEANVAKKASKVATQASQTSGVKTYFDDDEALRPVFDILESFDAKNAAKRRASNTGASIKYVQNGEDKIAVIERGKSLPKAITASRIKNERQEKIFEQIQKDLLAGKELNLSQIERELSRLENGLFDDKTEAISPLKQTPKGIKPSIAQSTQPSASIATNAGLSAASALSKDSKGFAGKSTKEAKESKEASKAGAQSTLAKEPSEPLSSTQQRQESILERNLATPQFAQNDEQEAFNEMLLAQKAQKQESSEAKAESKSEAKTLTNNAASTNPLRSEARTNNINAREALSSFVNQFEQEVKKFKPPMRQISMELSPKELGNIELTITQRGNSLHISVVSNPQALQLFAQNHGELRQNLLNAGFEGVDLSFSSPNGQSGQSGGQNQDSEQSQKGEANSLDSLAQNAQNNAQSEILAMEITLPRYA